MNFSVQKIDKERHPKAINCLSMISQFLWAEEDDYENILLLDANKEPLLRVGEFQHLANPTLWLGQKSGRTYTAFNPNETIEKAVARVPEKKKVCYVLDATSDVLYSYG